MRQLVAILCFLLVTHFLSAIQSHMCFRAVSPPGGLTFQSIHLITQDHAGNMWLGSKHGVYRYNSNGFTRFHHSPNKSNSLSNDIVNDLLIDDKNKLWVATAEGLDLFDERQQQFIHFNYSHHSQKMSFKGVLQISMDKNQKLWLIDNNGLGQLDTITKTIKYCQLTTKGFAPSIMYFDELHRGWIGTLDGSIYQLYIEDLKLQKVVDGPGSNVQSIYVDNNQIYSGYKSHGARIYSLHGKLTKHFNQTTNQQHNIATENVRTIRKDDNNTIWIGTYTGLFVQKENVLKRIDPKKYAGVVHNSIYTIYKDKTGSLWFGTWAGGLFYSNKTDNHFNTYHTLNTSDSFKTRVISSFTQDNDGSIYIGTEVGGLNKFIPSKGQFKPVPFGDIKEVINIKTLCTDAKGDIWAGTFNNQLWHKRKGKPFFKAVKNSHQLIGTTPIYALHPTSEGVWVGTFGKGLYFFDYGTEALLSLQQLGLKLGPHNQFIKSILVDSNNFLWIGTSSGLYRYNLQTGNGGLIKNKHRTTQNLSIHCIKELSNNEIWVGTKGTGLIRYQRAHDKNPIPHSDILPGLDVYGIQKDKQDYVWITTNSGLYLYYPVLDKWRHFSNSDGLQGNQFNPQAIFLDESYQLYIGGTNGFTYFATDQIQINTAIPNTIIEQVEINNQTKQFPRYIPTGNCYEPLLLKYNESSFKIQVASSNFLSPSKTRYKYRLKGMFNKWLDNDTDNNIVFTNIPPGIYHFEVKACNNDGVWSNSPTTFRITILAPWWLTSWAFGAYTILITSLFYFIYREIRQRQNLKKAVLISQIKQEEERRINEMKLKFFTNISHEFRTPLTLITGPVNALLQSQNLSDNDHHKLSVIQRNTSHLLKLINEILDFRKLQENSMKLVISRFEANNYLKECYKAFEEAAKAQELNYQFLGINETWIEADTDKLEKIVFNLLSNAFKNCSKGDSVIFELCKSQCTSEKSYSNKIKYGTITTDKYLEIRISDSGKGMTQQDLNQIFNRFEQGDKAISGSGIGLSLCKELTLLLHSEIQAESTLHKGSLFTVKLPLTQPKTITDGNTQINTDINSLYKPTESNIREENTKHTVLIAEDNADMRFFIKDILSPSYTVLSAKDGHEALTFMQNSSIDLVLSDIMMPGMNGYELCQTIKSRFETSHIPVILLTALATTNHELSGLYCGADDYLTKPFEASVLTARIENIIKQRQLLKNSFGKELSQGRISPIKTGNLDQFFLDKTTEIINANISNIDLTVEMLAQELAMSRGHLHRKIKQLTNCSPNQFIRLYRLKKAVEILETGQYNIEEITGQVGFNSPSYFSKCFKEVYGISPKHYRKKQH